MKLVLSYLRVFRAEQHVFFVGAQQTRIVARLQRALIGDSMRWNRHRYIQRKRLQLQMQKQTQEYG
jgi:hypothetical protein